MPCSLMAKPSILEAEKMCSQVFKVRIEPAGLIVDASALMTLLQACEQSGVSGLKIESSCRNGTCRVCMCQLTSGHVVYKIDWPGLSLEEKREGFILPCIASAASDLVMKMI